MLLKIKDFYKTFDKDFFLPKKSFFYFSNYFCNKF